LKGSLLSGGNLVLLPIREGRLVKEVVGLAPDFVDTYIALEYEHVREKQDACFIGCRTLDDGKVAVDDSNFVEIHTGFSQLFRFSLDSLSTKLGDISMECLSVHN